MKTLPAGSRRAGDNPGGVTDSQKLIKGAAYTNLPHYNDCPLPLHQNSSIIYPRRHPHIGGPIDVLSPNPSIPSHRGISCIKDPLPPAIEDRKVFELPDPTGLACNISLCPSPFGVNAFGTKIPATPNTLIDRVPSAWQPATVLANTVYVTLSSGLATGSRPPHCRVLLQAPAEKFKSTPINILNLHGHRLPSPYTRIIPNPYRWRRRHSDNNRITAQRTASLVIRYHQAVRCCIQRFAYTWIRYIRIGQINSRGPAVVIAPTAMQLGRGTIANRIPFSCIGYRRGIYSHHYVNCLPAYAGDGR